MSEICPHSMRRVFALAGFLLFIGGAACFADDHGNTWDTATSVTVNTSVEAALDTTSDVDFFSFQLQAGEYYVLDVALGTLNDSMITVYDTDGTTLIASDDNSGDGLGSRYSFVCPVDGIYFLRVFSVFSTSAGTYTFSVTRIDDDHGDSWDEATTLTLGLEIEGQLHTTNDVDYFWIELEAGRFYGMHLDGSGLTGGLADSILTLYGADGVSVIEQNDNDPFGGSDSRISYSPAETGRYYLKADGMAGATGYYTIVVKRNPALPFESVTDSAGISAVFDPWPAANDFAAAWGDYNNDGWADLYLASYDNAKGIFLFKNNKDGTFSDANVPNDTSVPMWWPGTFVDYDNNGLLDLYSAAAGGHLVRNNGESFGGLYSFIDRSSLLDAHNWQSETSAWGDFNGDGWLDFYRSGWEQGPYGPYYPDALFISNAGTHFDRVWWQENESDRKAGRGVTVADFDEDYDLDIYVSNYRISNNFLWLNDGAGNFTDVAEEYGAASDGNPCTTTYPGGHTIGSAWGDMDNDGHLDLIVGNFAHGTACQDRPLFLRNTGPLGGWMFEDATTTASIPYTESNGSVALGDYDNDGDLDVFIAAVSGESYPSYTEVSSLFRNDGDWHFTEVSAEMGFTSRTDKSNFMAAWADYDRDGDLDLMTGRELYRNSLYSDNHWLRVKVVGDGVSVDRMGVGTRVIVSLPGRKILRQVETSTGWGNQSEAVLHFGLGPDIGAPVTIEVYWLDGSVEWTQVEVDQTITLSKGYVTRNQVSGEHWTQY